MGREDGKGFGKSYGKGKNMIKICSQRQMKVQKVKLK